MFSIVTRNTRLVNVDTNKRDERIVYGNIAIMLDGTEYYFKKGDDIAIINELLGSAIASLFNLDTIQYMLARRHGNYGLLSKDFKEEGYHYYDLWTLNKRYDLRIPFPSENEEDKYNKNFKLADIISLISKLKYLCIDIKNYQQLTTELLKLAALDFYIKQSDRHVGNLILKMEKKEKDYRFSLAPIHDYENAFGMYEEFKDININNNKIITEVKKAFEIYPEFYEIFKSIQNINMEQLLHYIKCIHKIDISIGYKASYIEHDEIVKELVKKCIE